MKLDASINYINENIGSERISCKCGCSYLQKVFVVVLKENFSCKDKDLLRNELWLDIEFPCIRSFYVIHEYQP